MIDSLDISEDARRLFEFVKYAEKLKVELRAAHKSDNTNESSAEHSWMLALILMLLSKKLKADMNLEKALKMAIIHDIVEIDASDIPVLQHLNNKEMKMSKNIAEIKAINSIKARLGDEGIEIFELWNEFEKGQTLESKVVQAIDKLEGQWQFLSDKKYRFTEFDKATIPDLISKTSELCAIDPFLAELDKISLDERRKRIY